MEVTIETTRAGLSGGIVKDIKRLAPRGLIPHNVERQLAMRVHVDTGPLLEVGDLVIHRDIQEVSTKHINEVVLVEEGRIDLYSAVSDETFEAIPFAGDLIVFELAPREEEDAE